MSSVEWVKLKILHRNGKGTENSKTSDTENRNQVIPQKFQKVKRIGQEAKYEQRK